jgi:hypothetical protein
MKKNKFIEQVVTQVKRPVYGRVGEPYSFGDHKLRFSPGTRPVRTKYATSQEVNARNDALQVELVLRVLSSGDTAIDIGAHAGQYGFLMSSQCGQSGQVICFEPDPDAITMLENNFSLNKNLEGPCPV